MGTSTEAKIQKAPYVQIVVTQMSHQKFSLRLKTNGVDTARNFAFASARHLSTREGYIIAVIDCSHKELDNEKYDDNRQHKEVGKHEMDHASDQEQ